MDTEEPHDHVESEISLMLPTDGEPGSASPSFDDFASRLAAAPPPVADEAQVAAPPGSTAPVIVPSLTAPTEIVEIDGDHVAAMPDSVRKEIERMHRRAVKRGQAAAGAATTATTAAPRLRLFPWMRPNARTEPVAIAPSFDELVPAPAPEPLAELRSEDITAWFGDHQVLDRVSLTMPAGVVTALIGPSGCGKSTFLRILNRMHELIPSASLAGSVLLDGDDIYDRTRPITEARKHIGMVFQKPNPFPAMSIYENVLAGLRLTGTRVDRDRADFLVERSLRSAGLWNEVKDRLRAPGGGLSGGQQQRLCIARSLAVTPKVLLMDEPCSALDPTSTRVIEETMLELAKEVTIVIVTHNMQQAQRVSTQCAFFLASQGKPGGIVEHGDTDAMFSDPIDSRTYDYVNGRFG